MPDFVQVQPLDEFNRALLEQTHPPGWQNPEPASRYNLVVLGAGTAGLVTAAGAAGLGARVALIERELMGGDCLNIGCVPSKALIRSARAFADVRDAGRFGVEVPAGARVNFAAVMERMRRARAGISPNDSAARFRGLGVDVFFGAAKFTGADTVEVEGKTLRFHRAVIATGARASRIPVPGLAETGFLTNETVFSLTELPRRLAIVGAGPIGCELAQAFARFGAEVTVLEALPQIMGREDRDAAEIVRKALEKDGVRFLLSCQLQRVERQDRDKVLHVRHDGKEQAIHVDEILLGVGRTPNVEGLGLETVGVKFDAKTGVVVDDHLRTTNPAIFAAGDVCSRFKFTHAADALARIVIQNALFPPGRARASALTIPWCTYTDPEVAHVGKYESEAKEQGIALKTYVQPLHDVDRAILDGETEGFVKVHVKDGTDRIVGATVVARHAGEMISELTLAMVGKLGLGTLARTIHPYPTQADAIKKVGDAYNRTRLTPFVKKMFEKWLAWRRS